MFFLYRFYCMLNVSIFIFNDSIAPCRNNNIFKPNCFIKTVINNNRIFSRSDLWKWSKAVYFLKKLIFYTQLLNISVLQIWCVNKWYFILVNKILLQKVLPVYAAFNFFSQLLVFFLFVFPHQSNLLSDYIFCFLYSCNILLLLHVINCNNLFSSFSNLVSLLFLLFLFFNLFLIIGGVKTDAVIMHIFHFENIPVH